MKINLLRNAAADAMNGYTNIDPFGDGPSTIRGELVDLSYCVDDGEASEIVARDILDFFDPPFWDIALNGWIKKLAHGGKLVIGGVDMIEVSRALANFSISILDANRLLHGVQDTPWNCRKTNASLLEIVALLQAKGLLITKKRLSGFEWCVEAVRQ